MEVSLLLLSRLALEELFNRENLCECMEKGGGEEDLKTDPFSCIMGNVVFSIFGL